MEKAGIFSKSNGKTVLKKNSLFGVENFPLLRKYKRHLPYLLVADWGISKAIHEYGQDIIDTL